MGQRRFIAGLVGAVLGMVGRGGGKTQKAVRASHTPAHDRWREPSPPGFGRWGGKTRSAKAGRKYRKMRGRLQREARSRSHNRSQRRSQN